MKRNVLSFPSLPTEAPADSLDARLRFAIANKRLIEFKYDGATRVAEPHDYGLRDGSVTVLAFQRKKAGQQNDDVRGWRSLEVSKIEECVVLEDTFRGTREQAAQHHQEWDVLYARVDHTD
jgi:hypothetical protein